MFRRIFAHLGLTALTLLGASLTPESAVAQQGQHLYEWSGGWGRSSSGFSSRGGYRGTSYPTAAYSEGSTPSPGSRVTEYRSFYPQQAGDDYGPVRTSAGGNGSDVNRAVWLTVSVPANAKIWFDEARTTQTGSLRQFLSPPLTPGHEYVYEVKASWTEAGKEVTRSRRVNVHAGDVTRISFDSDAAE